MATYHCLLCPEIENEFENVNDLMAHQTFAHQNLEGVLWCPRCRVGFPNRRYFDSHGYACQGHQVVAITNREELEELEEDAVESSSRSEIDHYCNFCRNKFGTAKRLQQHQHQKHPERLKVFCSKCNRGFERKIERKEHQDNCYNNKN